MRSFLLHCPHLGRDVSNVLVTVPDVQVLTGLPTERGEDGCLAMHQRAVAIAEENDLPYALVLEDDCTFKPGVDILHIRALAQLGLEHGFDVLTGGVVGTYDAQLTVTNPVGTLVQVSRFHSAHCVIYYRWAYAHILRRARQPYDLSLGEMGLKCGVILPFIAVQRASFSGILREPVNYEPLYDAHEAHLLRLFPTAGRREVHA